MNRTTYFATLLLAAVMAACGPDTLVQVSAQQRDAAIKSAFLDAAVSSTVEPKVIDVRFYTTEELCGLPCDGASGDRLIGVVFATNDIENGPTRFTVGVDPVSYETVLTDSRPLGP